MNKTKKIYSAIYIVSRALFFVSAFALFFALLPPAEEGARRIIRFLPYVFLRARRLPYGARK